MRACYILARDRHVRWTSFDAERKTTPTATQGLNRDYAGAPGYQAYARMPVS